MDPQEPKKEPEQEDLKTISGEIPLPESLGGPAPDRYIRTFSGDMDVVQRGGVPGLSPLKRKPPAPAPSEPTMLQSGAKPSEPDEALVMPLEPKPEFTPKLPPTPEPTPVPEPAPLPKEPAPALVEQKPAPIETYADDFRRHLKETHASTATVLAAEQDAKQEEPEPEAVSAPSSHSPLFIALGVVLVLLGAAGVFYAYSNYLSTTAPVLPVGPTTVAPIFVDSTDPISGTGRDLMQAIAQEVAKPLSPNTVRLLSFSSASSTNALLSLGVPVPGIVARNINDAGDMAGVVNVQGTQSPFFIESVDLYSATFSGMLSWEPTMQKDLGLLYPLYPVQAPPAATTTSTSTPVATTTQTAPVVTKTPGFRDEVVSNHDVRTYRDGQNRSILIYGYWNQNTLVIARDPAAFAEILDRLATSRAQ